jgi:hypothetical protein
VSRWIATAGSVAIWIPDAGRNSRRSSPDCPAFSEAGEEVKTAETCVAEAFVSAMTWFLGYPSRMLARMNTIMESM